MAKTKKEESAPSAIKPIEMVSIPIRIVGDTPLITHAWSEKAKRMILEAQQKKSKGKDKDPKDPVEDFIRSLYWLTPMPKKFSMEAFYEAVDEGAMFGFPVTAFKQAGVSAAYRMGWVKDKMGLRGTFFLQSPFGDLAQIKGSTPTMREDMVKVGMGVADIRFRGQFDEWSVDLVMHYNKNGQFNAENLLNILQAGGTVCGAGEWRPERDGQYGMYHVEVLKHQASDA